MRKVLRPLCLIPLILIPICVLFSGYKYGPILPSSFKSRHAANTKTFQVTLALSSTETVDVYDLRGRMGNIPLSSLFVSGNLLFEELHALLAKEKVVELIVNHGYSFILLAVMNVNYSFIFPFSSKIEKVKEKGKSPDEILTEYLNAYRHNNSNLELPGLDDIIELLSLFPLSRTTLFFAVAPKYILITTKIATKVFSIPLEPFLAMYGIKYNDGNKILLNGSLNSKRVTIFQSRLSLESKKFDDKVWTRSVPNMHISETEDGIGDDGRNAKRLKDILSLKHKKHVSEKQLEIFKKILSDLWESEEFYSSVVSLMHKLDGNISMSKENGSNTE